MNSFVPSQERIPGVYQTAELQRQGGLAPLARSVLLIGYYSGAEELEGVIQPVESRNQVQRDYGAGTMIDLMVREAIKAGELAQRDQERGSVPQLYTLGLTAPAQAGDVASTYPFTITGTAAANGTLRIILGPDDFAVPVLAGENQDVIAVRAQEFISRNGPEMAFTAGLADNVITLTARHTGLWGNELTAYTETRNAPGVTAAIERGTEGVGNLDLSAVLDSTYAQDFDAVVVPQYDEATRSLLKPHVEDGWDYTRKRYRLIVAAQGGDVSTAQTAAAAIDDFRVVLAHAERTASVRDSARSLSFEVAAAVAGRLWSQDRANWNFNRATLPSYGRPKSIDRDTLNDTVAAGVCEVVEPSQGRTPGAFVDPITTAVTDQTGITQASDTTYQPVEYAKTTAFLLRQMQIELDRFSQMDADDETRISAIAAARTVLQRAADGRLIRRPSDKAVTAAIVPVGGRTDLVLDLEYEIIVGLDVVAVRHRVRAAGSQA